MRFIYTKAFAIFASSVCLVVALIFLQLKGWLDPIRLAVLHSPRPVAIAAGKITLPVKNFFIAIYQLKKIADENVQLKARVLSLQQDLAQENQQARENEALRKELGLIKNSRLDVTACTVLSDHPFGVSDALVLNCGSRAGVEIGQAVISQGYLVGKIIYAGPSTSSVLLATDSNFSTDARLSTSGQAAIVRGSFGSGLVLDQVPQTSGLQPGWLVVTGGINQKIPKNILIGAVSDIFSSPSDLFKRAAVTSPIDFNNLEFVFVVKQ